MLCAINSGPSTHLDHLAPLCEVLNIPLIITEADVYDLAKHFYPMIEIKHIPLERLSLSFMAQNFTAIVTCGKFWAMEVGGAIEALFGKRIRFIFAPHGKSDKEDLLDMPKVKQDIELIYSGAPRENRIVIGDIRRWFYTKYKSHFDSFCTSFFSETKKNVLYAPTWQTKATDTSFFSEAGKMIQQLSDRYHLLVKLHPLLEENDPATFYRILGQYEDRVKFILNFPPVLPLLEKTDIYLGDYSSIGYDFLFYDRPMFFLKSGGVLQRCGQPYLESLENSQSGLSEVRQGLYNQSFATFKPEDIKASLMGSLEKNYSSS